MPLISAIEVEANMVFSALQQLDEIVGKELLRSGLTAAGEIVLAEVKARAPVLRSPDKRWRPGAHRDALKLKVRVGKRTARATIETGTRRELGIPAAASGYYPAAQEFGWNSAERKREVDRMVRRRRGRIGSRRRLARKVLKRTHAGQPHMRPGTEAASSRAIAAFSRVVVQGVSRVRGRR